MILMQEFTFWRSVVSGIIPSGNFGLLELMPRNAIPRPRW